MEARFTIRAVAERSGVSVHTIRAWEKRYRALAPGRTETNRRFYSEEDVARLILLRNALEAGHTISLIAELTNPELAQLGHRNHPATSHDDAVAHIRQSCERAIQSLDADLLTYELCRAHGTLGLNSFLDQVVAPLLVRIGSGWETGEIGIAQEHLASAVFRRELEAIRTSLGAKASDPVLISTTPVGQLHELGALLAAVVAAGEGWNAVFLGANMPASEIVGAASRLGARVVALSLIHPENDPLVTTDLQVMAEQLPRSVGILVGGRAAHSYASSLQAIGAKVCQTLPEMREELSRARSAR